MFKNILLKWPLVISVVLVVFAPLAFSSPAFAVPAPGSDCSSLVMGKSYANSFSGLINLPVYLAAFHVTPPAGSGLGPAGGGGTLTFSSGGAFTLKETLTTGMLGVNKDVAITGTYQLTYLSYKNPIVCTGSMSGHGLLLNHQVPFNYQLIVSADGSRVEMLETDSGSIVGITSWRMPASGTCSNANLNDSFSVGEDHSDNAAGWMLNTSAASGQMLNDYVPLAISGALQFSPETSPSGFPTAPSGAAALTAWETISVDGSMLPVPFTGWYLVNSNCTGSMLLHATNSAVSDTLYEIFLAADGSVQVVDENNPKTLANGASTPSFIIGARLTPLAPAP